MEFVCKHCGVSFTSLYKTATFCSLSCSTSYHNMRRVKVVHKKQCLNCKKEFISKRTSSKFCSRSCSASFNNKGKTKKVYGTFTCIYCNKVHNNIYRASTRKFCNTKCQAEYTTQCIVKAWQQDSTTGYSKGGQGLKRSIRRYLIKQSNYKCSKCGWGETNPFTGKVPLEVDHIDGNYRNNKPENLQVLCPNCHSLTNTWKALNKGNGRPSRNNTPV